MKTVLPMSIVLATTFLWFGCAKKTNQTGQQSDQQNMTATPPPNAVAGIHWTVPEGWTAQPKQPMRAATYAVPSPKEGQAAGDCGVFFFGHGQGGTVEENLNRWVSQFENGGKHEFASQEVNGLKVSTVRVQGTYLSPSGPMMESQGKKPDYKLLGAIVEAPEGVVFFKFVGPSQTVDANTTQFNQMISSLAKDETVAGK